jgi:hypothetical protein
MHDAAPNILKWILSHLVWFFWPTLAPFITSVCGHADKAPWASLLRRCLLSSELTNLNGS